MFLRIPAVLLAILGLLILLTSSRLVNWMLSFVPQDHLFKRPFFRKFLYVWPIWFIGLMCLYFAVWISISGPSTELMKSDKNCLKLLQDGVITKAQVDSVCYQRLAPSGWKVVYKFSLTEPSTGKVQTYWGSSQGPKHYYSGLSKGNSIQVIYLPVNPDINSEIRCFVNDPSYRYTFEETGKLELLNKFKDYSEDRHYSFEEWNQLQWKK